MDQTKPASPSGQSTCRRCGWAFPNPNPSSKHRRAHNRICGTIEGFATKLIIDASDAVSSYDSDVEDKEKTPRPKTEKRVIKEGGSSAGGVEEKPYRSEDDMFSAVTEFSDTGIISPGVTSDLKKVDDNSEVFESPISHSKDAVKVQENDTVPLVKDRDGPHKDKVIDQTDDVHTFPVANDTPLVDKAETLMEDFKDHNEKHSFEVKTVQESQTFDHHPVVTLGELIKTDEESVVSGSKDGVKVGISETVVGDGSGKVLTGQDSGAYASFCSSSNSLEGRWGSVSDISDLFGKSESRLGRSDAFKSPLVESEEETVDQKLQKSQPVKSEVKEKAIAKVTNWSTSGHIATAPLRKLMSRANSPKPKLLSDAGETSQSGKSKSKSNLTGETPEVNQESAPVENNGEGKIVKKKSKGISSLVRFVCCSVPVIRD